MQPFTAAAHSEAEESILAELSRINLPGYLQEQSVDPEFRTLVFFMAVIGTWCSGFAIVCELGGSFADAEQLLGRDPHAQQCSFALNASILGQSIRWFVIQIPIRGVLVCANLHEDIGIHFQEVRQFIQLHLSSA